MLSVLFGSVPKTFQKVLTFFIPPPATILDLTYGTGASWRGFQEETLTGRYKVIEVDRVSHPDLDMCIDFRDIDDIERVNGVYYDPPYGFSDTIYKKRVDGRIRSPPSSEYSPKEHHRVFSREEYCSQLDFLNTFLPKVLFKNGYFIEKIQDTRLNGIFISNHVDAIIRLNNLRHIDTIIYNVFGRHYLRYKSYTKLAHGYYLIFQKKEAL